MHWKWVVETFQRIRKLTLSCLIFYHDVAQNSKRILIKPHKKVIYLLSDRWTENRWTNLKFSWLQFKGAECRRVSWVQAQLLKPLNMKCSALHLIQKRVFRSEEVYPNITITITKSLPSFDWADRCGKPEPVQCLM